MQWRGFTREPCSDVSERMADASFIRVAKWLLVAIVLLAASLRIWGINFGLPYLYHPDEPWTVNIAQNMFKTGDTNPHFFQWPSLLMYLNALAYLPYYLVGRLAGVFGNPADVPGPITIVMGVGRAPMPTTFLLGRILSVIFGSAAVALIFLVGWQLTKSTIVGLMAALMMAISPVNVTLSRYITPDMILTFFVLLSFWGSVRVVQHGKTVDYIVAGVAAGLAASTKYNGAVILVSLLTAHFLRCGLRGFREPIFYIAVALSGVTFLLINPFVILDYPEFIAGLLHDVRHYSTGHLGMEGNALGYYLNYLWQDQGLVAFLAALEIFRGLYKRSKQTLVIASFPLIYLLFVSGFQVRNTRTLLPLIPFLFLLASSLLVSLLEQTRIRQLTGKLLVFVVVTVLSISLAFGFVNTVKDTIRLTTVDSRETARAWIDHNLPSGSRIAIEAYAPYVDPQRFFVQGIEKMIDQTPNWYTDNGFQYLVFGQWMFGRFYAQPDRYSSQVSQYEELFAAFYLVKRFTDGGYEVRVYSTAPPGPSHEVMANFGGLVQLVCYYMDSEVEAGTPLRFVLYWKRVGEMERQYSAFSHLIDTDWRMLGQSDGVPQAGEGLVGGWGEGQIVEDRRMIDIPEDMPAGEYRLEVGVYASETMERLVLKGSSRGELDDRVLTVPVRVLAPGG